jgi:hypothetical protein
MNAVDAQGWQWLPGPFSLQMAGRTDWQSVSLDAAVTQGTMITNAIRSILEVIDLRILHVSGSTGQASSTMQSLLILKASF